MITYERIHLLRDVEHRSIQRIADDLGLNFRTVKKYLEMSREEFDEFTNSITQKLFVLEPYKEFIVQRLSLYPDTSAAQMHDCKHPVSHVIENKFASAIFVCKTTMI